MLIYSISTIIKESADISANECLTLHSRPIELLKQSNGYEHHRKTRSGTKSAQTKAALSAIPTCCAALEKEYSNSV